MALTNKLTNIADAIRTKTGSTATMTLDEMVTAIQGIEGGGTLIEPTLESITITENGTYIPDDAIDGYNEVIVNVEGDGGDIDIPVVTGNCSYRFSNNGWNWLIDRYGDKITTSKITSADHMFYQCNELEEIPFEINLDKTVSSMDSMFRYCQKLEVVPQVNFTENKITTNVSFSSMFSDCYSITEIPQWISDFDFTVKNNSTSTFGYSMFSNCYGLRKVPENFLKKLWNKATSGSSTPYNNLFNMCYCLDEVKSLGVPQGTISNLTQLNTVVNACFRLKTLTFDTNEDGTPKVANYRGTTLQLESVGMPANISYSNNTAKYGEKSGVNWSKAVYDDITYQALKNDHDWWSSGGYNNGNDLSSSSFNITTALAYSRYNHDSAVETINSLPDTHTYGTNTIRFRGEAGSATDGGAINTLTDAEIAVAAAKGWTVTFV